MFAGNNSSALCKIGAFVFHTVVHWHKLGEMKNKCILHNSIVLAIFMPKIIKISENLTQLWQKQFWLFFETLCTNTCRSYLDSYGVPVLYHIFKTIRKRSSPMYHILILSHTGQYLGPCLYLVRLEAIACRADLSFSPDVFFPARDLRDVWANRHEILHDGLD